VNVLGIETSCDETAAAVVRDGRDILANVVFSQVAAHQPYGGVVPEIASRQHVEHLPVVLAAAMREAHVAWPAIDAVAVTYGPGLATSLLVGLAAAKGLALRLNKPLIGINHLEAHLYSIFLGSAAPVPAAACPFLALIISGGHTCIVRVEAPGRYRLLGRTMDDAAGEAFDKGANLLGLGYPGGPAIDKLARSGNPQAVRFPRGFQRKAHARIAGLDPNLCFSFSGLKTALRYYLREPAAQATAPADVAASYQEAIVDTLVERLADALRNEKALAAVGGVSLNGRLRQKLAVLAARRGVPLFLAAPALCTDNAAMIAGLACTLRAPPGTDPMDLDADPTLGIGDAPPPDRAQSAS
jgi:N6-L-threonylcarbamoyladenine synthase